MVESALKSSGLTGDRLTLELTESSIVQDPVRATRVFDALKSLDASVAMDDFGTGYSSLAYLQRLPIDVLKIDKSFVSGMMVDPDAVAIVRAVLSLAEALGMSTTAEGIETVELATTLATLGCASGQGFYFARPLEPDTALEYWKSRRRSASRSRVAPPAAASSRQRGKSFRCFAPAPDGARRADAPRSSSPGETVGGARRRRPATRQAARASGSPR